MPMRADLWFPQIVWKDTITNMDNAAIKAHVLETKNTNQGKTANFWFNVNPKGSYNTLHNHQDSILSGVYYIDIPDENMGNIEFHRDDEAQYYIPENLDRYTQFTSTKATYKPETGLLLIFPSWLKHFVQGNQSEHLRISMSFNTELDIQK
jgi:uncharacterized protein (TIGR02466 family)